MKKEEYKYISIEINKLKRKWEGDKTNEEVKELKKKVYIKKWFGMIIEASSKSNTLRSVWSVNRDEFKDNFNVPIPVFKNVINSPKYHRWFRKMVNKNGTLIVEELSEKSFHLTSYAEIPWFNTQEYNSWKDRKFWDPNYESLNCDVENIIGVHFTKILPNGKHYNIGGKAAEEELKRLGFSEIMIQFVKELIAETKIWEEQEEINRSRELEEERKNLKLVGQQEQPSPWKNWKGKFKQ